MDVVKTFHCITQGLFMALGVWAPTAVFHAPIPAQIIAACIGFASGVAWEIFMSQGQPHD